MCDWAIAAISNDNQNLATQRSGPRGIFEGSLECAIQNGLKGNCAIQSGRGCMTSFGNSPALGFFPTPAVEEAGGFETRPVDAVEAARIDGNAVRL